MRTAAAPLEAAVADAPEIIATAQAARDAVVRHVEQGRAPQAGVTVRLDDAAPQTRAPASGAIAAKAAAPTASAATSGSPNDVAKIASSDAPQSAPTPQPLSAPISTQAQTHVRHAADNAARALPAAHQVAHEIVRRFDGGATRFELRLDPPELGRVEVRLDVSRDHRVSATIAADSPQAVTELARHARELEQLLSAAGLDLGDNGLSFDLRQGGERAEAEAFGASGGEDGAVAETAPVAARPIGLERWRGVRVDMMV